MSEEILKALTQLFAIVTKQDGGVSENERQFVITFFQQELDRDSISEYLELYDNYSGYSRQGTPEEDKVKITSVKDSIKTLGICKKINKTLTQKQKVVVLTKLLELVGSDKSFTPQRMEIIHTVATVFNILQDEYKLIETFVVAEKPEAFDFPDILIVNKLSSRSSPLQKHLHVHVEGNLFFMRVQSVDLYFVRYAGEESNVLNSFIMLPNKIYLFSHGSTIKTQGGDALYYSDLIGNFNEQSSTTKLSFNASIEEFKFHNGAVGLRNIMVTEGPGKLIGIMGASGAGKTTLLMVLAGLEQPSKGNILINGFDIHTENEHIRGVIGFVSQDDLLIEELTVYQNLYYNARLCFANYTEIQLHARVTEVLENLGLDQRKDLKVGSVLDKKISGGQRKRLNIALELIREPAVLFLDEPTSGLSSRDSENVIDLLKELSLKGKLIFVVIHQPSSDIYKMFDKMIIMDTGGFQAYYGTPVEAVTYFKKATLQAASNRGQCETCGNVNPEQIFNIMEAKVVDEYGQPTAKRKINPPQWYDMYKERFRINRVEDIREDPPQNLQIPNKVTQTVIFTTRDFLSKISNKQYLLINLLEAPLLAVILSFIIKYKSAPGGKEYIFRFNENFPAFLLMGIIVALFMGLTVSAEEIIRDRKILRRESFLNLSWNSYLVSKLAILFLLSAVQTSSFVLISNLILEVHGMTFAFWLVLFSTSCFANVLGLNISSAFNSAVTVYVMIPLLLIPQMILSGLLFSFERLNNILSTRGKVPIVADVMVSRWAYEAMAVHQFTTNDFEEPFYTYEKAEAEADFKSTYLADELARRSAFVLDNLSNKNDSIKAKVISDLSVIRNILKDEPFEKEMLLSANVENRLTPDQFGKPLAQLLEDYSDRYHGWYLQLFNKNTDLKERKMSWLEKDGFAITKEKNRHYNESLADLVRNVSVKKRWVEYHGKIIQEINPVFQDAQPSGLLDYRAPFFAPEKHFLGVALNTFLFNIAVIWLMAAFCYLALYWEWLRKIVKSMSKLNLARKR